MPTYRHNTRRALFAAVLAACARHAFADTTWQSTTGDWSDPANWTTGVPDSATNANISNAGIAQISSSSAASYFYLGQNISQTGSLVMATSSTLAIAGKLYVGYSGSGTFNQSAGRNTTVSPFTTLPDLYMGYNTGSNGVYILTGSSTRLAKSDEFIGYYGTGSFYQTGGRNDQSNGSTPNGWYLGTNPGGVGQYVLTGGALTVVNGIIGDYGVGTFTQSGGTFSPGNLWMAGAASTSAGVYYLSGTGVLNALDEVVGRAGFGSFSQTGGSHGASNLSIGSSSVSTGYYLLSGAGALVTVSGSTTVGGANHLTSGGHGFLNIEDGAMNAGTILTLWDTAGNAINLSGGSLTAGTFSIVGNAFTQSGGSFAVSNLSQTGGTVTLGGPQSLYNIPTVSISTGTATLAAGAAKILVTSSISITSATKAKLDLTTGDLLLHSTASSLASTYSTLRSYVTSNKITSSSASPTATLALMKSSDYLTLHPGTLFSGQTLTPTDLLIKYTYTGDADLDGLITLNDYSLLEAGFLLGNFDPINNPASWVNGDFNNDGKIDMTDFALIDAAFAAQSGTLAMDEISTHANEFGTPYISALHALSPIPEPTSLALIALSSATLLLRRSSPRSTR